MFFPETRTYHTLVRTLAQLCKKKCRWFFLRFPHSYFGIFFRLQGGQFILNLVDFFGPQSIAFILALFEVIAVCWIYGEP